MSPSPASAKIHLAFETFREHLDEHYDRRERLIKASRDITAASKKVIFLIHRILNEASGDDRALSLRAATEARTRLAEVRLIVENVAHELDGSRFWRYAQNISGGLQEYIEAFSFFHYIECGRLVSYEQVQANLSDGAGQPLFPVPLSDYALGISDFTGELMRLAITSMSKPNGRTKATQISEFVRGCKAGIFSSQSCRLGHPADLFIDLEILTPHLHDLHKKQVVTTQSLRKIEEAAYAIAIRSSEYELSPWMLDHIVSQVSEEKES